MKEFLLLREGLGRLVAPRGVQPLADPCWLAFGGIPGEGRSCREQAVHGSLPVLARHCQVWHISTNLCLRSKPSAKSRERWNRRTCHSTQSLVSLMAHCREDHELINKYFTGDLKDTGRDRTSRAFHVLHGTPRQPPEAVSTARGTIKTSSSKKGFRGSRSSLFQLMWHLTLSQRTKAVEVQRRVETMGTASMLCNPTKHKPSRP